MRSITGRGNRGTVLIVDDDPSVLVVIKAILTTASYRVLLAVEGDDAIRLARQKHIHIDVALLDVRLPGIHGTQLAGELLSIRPSLRVLLCPAFLTTRLFASNYSTGMPGFCPSRSKARVSCRRSGRPWMRCRPMVPGRRRSGPPVHSYLAPQGTPGSLSVTGYAVEWKLLHEAAYPCFAAGICRLPVDGPAR